MRSGSHLWTKIRIELAFRQIKYDSHMRTKLEPRGKETNKEPFVILEKGYRGVELREEQWDGKGDRCKSEFLAPRVSEREGEEE